MREEDQQDAVLDAEVLDRVSDYQSLSPSDRLVARQRIIADYPTLRVALEDCLDGLELLDGITPIAIEKEAYVDPVLKEELGDFELVREIGRGGMGVVYEARQRSLGRHVALKVLPYAAFLNPSRLQRFKQEAQAAAMLRHPNIVHVHCVGSERGVHYYAMQLIEGQSLAHLVAEERAGGTASGQAETVPIAALSTVDTKRAPSRYRQVAKLGIQIADALEYAHQQGIVHRDIKPSNLLLDAAGKPWVTDFGLAQTQNDGNLTATGDVLGTIRYMSPEQAEGTKLLDHRTDVYSLAATLYELLAFQPVVTGATRQQMVQQLAEGHVKPPRNIDSGVPRDLEKVLLKALAFRAEDRYASAAEFADDLRRFTEDRPVQARPIGKVRKATRWASRHRLVSALVACTALLLLSISIIAPIVALRFQAERDAAKQSNEELIDMLYESVDATTQTFENVPNNPLVKPEFITNTFDRIDRLLAEAPTNSKLRLTAGVAYRDLGWAADFRYNDPRAHEWYQKSQAILSDLVADYPDNLEYKDDLGYALRLVVAETKHGDAAIAAYLALRRELVAKAPNNLTYLTNYGVALGTAAYSAEKKNNRKEAEALYDECDAVLAQSIRSGSDDDDTRCIRAWFKSHHANLISQQDTDAAIEKFEQALELFGDDFSNSAIVTRWKIGRVSLLRFLAGTLRRSKRFTEAEQYVRQAASETTALMHGFPESDWLQMEHFLAHTSLLQLLWGRGEIEEAISVGRRTLAEWGKPLEEGPKCQNCLEYHLGNLLWWHGDRAEARELLRRSIQCPSPDWARVYFITQCPDLSLRDYATALDVIRDSDRDRPGVKGLIHYRLGNFDVAQRLLLEAVDAGDSRARTLCYSALAHSQLGDVAEAQRYYELALKAADEVGVEDAHEIQGLIEEFESLLGSNSKNAVTR